METKEGEVGVSGGEDEWQEEEKGRGIKRDPLWLKVTLDWSIGNPPVITPGMITSLGSYQSCDN